MTENIKQKKIPKIFSDARQLVIYASFIMQMYKVHGNGAIAYVK